MISNYVSYLNKSMLFGYTFTNQIPNSYFKQFACSFINESAGEASHE